MPSCDEDTPASAAAPCQSAGDDREKNLPAIIDTLSLNDRALLYAELRDLHSNGHFYHHQWRPLRASHPELLDLSFEILRKYESNGLQLHGYGCWFFEQVVVSVGLPLSSSQKMSPDQMLEMILRVLLEHRTFLSCSQVLTKLCTDEPKYFESICEIGFRIFEELPVPIKSDNFCVLFLFALNFLRANWTRPLVGAEWNARLKVFSMLTVISTRVEASLLTEYHVNEALALAHRLYSELLLQQQQDEQHAAMCVLFQFLACLVPLHHSHAGRIYEAGFLTIAMDYVVQCITIMDTEGEEEKLLKTETEATAETAIEISATEPKFIQDLQQTKRALQLAVQLITAALSSADVLSSSTTLDKLFPQLQLSHLLRLLSVKRGLLIKEAVTLFVTTFGHFIATSRSNSPGVALDNEADIRTFLAEFLDQAVGLFTSQGRRQSKEKRQKDFIGGNAEGRDSGRDRGWGGAAPPAWEDHTSDQLPPLNALKDLWASMRVLGRDVFLLSILETDEFAARRSVLLRCIEGLLQAPTAEKVDMGEEDEHDSKDSVSFDMEISGIMCVDAIATLGGWVDNCWRDSLSKDKQIHDILAATHVKFLRQEPAAGSVGGESARDSSSVMSALSGGRDRESVVSVGVSVRSASDSDASRVSGEEKLMKLRASFSTLNLQTSPVGEEEEVAFNDIIEEVVTGRCDSRDKCEKTRSSLVTRGQLRTDDVEDFLVDWEVESTACVCYKIMKLVGVSRNHPLGLVSLESLDLVGLAEVLIELLGDDRHGLSEQEGMQEKCIQLLTDIVPLSDSIGTLAAEQVDVVLELLSDWNNFTDLFLVQSCLSALIAMANFSNTARRHIMDNLDKIQILVQHINFPIFLLAVLELCCAVMPAFKKANYHQEILMFDWIMQCLSFKTKPMIMRACQLIYKLSLVNPAFISKALSRHAIEHFVINVVDASEDKELILAALRTLTIFANNFNITPVWMHNRWVSLPAHCVHVLSGRRELLSPALMTNFLHLQDKFEEPFNLIILAYSLEIISTLRCLPATHFGDAVDASNYSSKFYTVYMPLVAGLLAMITRSHVFCEVPEDVDECFGTEAETEAEIQGGGRSTSTESTNSKRSIKEHSESHLTSSSCHANLYDGLMSMRLEEINPVYELLGASVVNSLHSLITSEDEHGHRTLDTFYSFSEHFRSTPICESIIYLMIQLPNNFVAQVKGIIALEALLSRGIGARILAECCTRVLTSAIISFVDDGEVHHAFCSIVNILSTRDEKTKAQMVAAGVHKWLYVVMKSASLATSSLSCRALFNLMNNSEENTLIIGNSGIIRPVLMMLEKHPQDLRVQFEGLRLITALCKTKAVFRKIKENKGEAAITAARKMLTGVYKLMVADARAKSIKSSQIIRSNSSSSSSSTSMGGDACESSAATGLRRSSSCNSDNRSDNADETTSSMGSGSDQQTIRQELQQTGEPTSSGKDHDHKVLPEDNQKHRDKGEIITLDYTMEDIKDLLDMSTPTKLSQQKCVIM